MNIYFTFSGLKKKCISGNFSSTCRWKPTCQCSMIPKSECFAIYIGKVLPTIEKIDYILKLTICSTLSQLRIVVIYYLVQTDNIIVYIITKIQMDYIFLVGKIFLIPYLFNFINYSIFFYIGLICHTSNKKKLFMKMDP